MKAYTISATFTSESGFLVAFRKLHRKYRTYMTTASYSNTIEIKLNYGNRRKLDDCIDIFKKLTKQPNYLTLKTIITEYETDNLLETIKERG